MKQSPYKFQGNNSVEAKRAKTKGATEPEEKKDKPSLAPKNLKKGQSKSKSHIQIRTARAPMAQRPKGNG